MPISRCCRAHCGKSIRRLRGPRREAYSVKPLQSYPMPFGGRISPNRFSLPTEDSPNRIIDFFIKIRESVRDLVYYRLLLKFSEVTRAVSEKFEVRVPPLSRSSLFLIAILRPSVRHRLNLVDSRPASDPTDVPI
jgi:hypothetical protein